MLSERVIKAMLKVAVVERMAERFESMADRIASKWEAPSGGRKYWRLKRDNGSYEYREKPPEEQGSKVKREESRVEQEGQEDKGKKKTKKKPEQKEYKHHISLDKPALKKLLSEGYFTIISAGRNPKDSKEGKMDVNDEYFHKRNETLKDELEKMGYNYTEAEGHYKGREHSLMVFHEPVEITKMARKSFMIHHNDADELKKRKKGLEELGTKLNQDSVLHGSAGKNTMYYTTGKRKGQECSGQGWNEAPDADDFYTDVKLKGKKHTKFQLDLKECEKKGFFND